MKKKLLIPFFLVGMAIPVAMQQSEISGAKALFIGEYGDEKSYIRHATEIGGQLADEGFVLLKNDGYFPLAKGKKISCVGKASVDFARGGAGSGAGSVSSGVTSIDLEKSLKDAGFDVNATCTSFYKGASGGRTNGNDGWKGNSEVTIGETPVSAITDAVKTSWSQYNDLAIQVITREGSEGCDVLTIDATDSTKYGSSEKHALELSDNEQALFDLLHQHFQHILIIVNSSNIFECDQFEKDSKVSGVLWIGNPGDVGPGAIGRILCGDVNPSGRTVDTWTRDFTKDPTFQNFSDNRQFGEAIPNTSNRLKHASLDTMFAADGSPMLSYGTDKNYSSHSSPRWLEKTQKVVQGGINGVKPASYVSYEEGVYLDYRYHETRYQDMLKDEGETAADAWYDGQEGVVYPFGYGLSYTTFTQEIIKVRPAKNTALIKANDTVEVTVRVKNTGTVAGKDAVQLYWRAPYIKGGIEKADHVLCAFDKTEIIQPGQTQDIQLQFYLQDVANYDFSDANKNGFKGYELDAGNYEVLLAKDAHEFYDKAEYTIGGDGIQYKTDRFTHNEVKNRFTDRGFYSSMPGENDIEFTQMSRADFEGTFPTHPTIEDRTVKAGSRYEEFLTHEYSLYDFETETDFEYTPEGAHRTEDDAIDGDWKQAESTLAKADRTQLIEMLGYDLNDPKWDEFINEFTWDELMKYVEKNGMSSPSLSEIGKSGASEGDGPQKFKIMWWVSSPIIAATFNPRLAHEQGECIGMESQITGKSGWWGCAVNTHRSPFGGRNFEYYSADPFLMGRIAANVVGAATDRGVFAYFKHFAVNDQEKNRESGISFVNEQALREIYLKSFQMVFEEGKSIGVMGSYNRLGLMETAASYPLMTEVLRGEWGFKGSVLSDMTHSGNGSVNFKCYECVTWRVLAGCNCQLDSGGFSKQTQSQAKWDSEVGAPLLIDNDGNQTDIVAYSFWNACRQAVKQHMYMTLHSTLMQRGMTQVIGQSDLTANSYEDVSYNIANDVEEAGVTAGTKVNVYNSSNSATEKTISTIDSFELNERCELPRGLAIKDGVISGQFVKAGTHRIDVIANVTFTDGSKGAVAYKYVIDVFSGDNAPETDPLLYDEDYVAPEPEPETKKGCFGSIITTSAILSGITLLGAALISFKKKED